MSLIVAIVLALFVLPPALGIVVISGAIALEIAEVYFWLKFLRRYRVQTGAEGLVGEAAEVFQALDPEGRVRLRGEIWRARSSAPAAAGERVRVTGVNGLTLEVEREGERAAPAP
jgi:membrane-bound serine protease (ClpP class)